MPEKVVIIGGGLSGCLAALMLAKQIRPSGSEAYDVTLVDSADSLLTGASMVGFRLHLGGEYILDPPTMHNCVEAAVIHQLLLPENIYTETPTMQFLIARGVEEFGRANPDHETALTLDKFERHYDTHVRKPYGKLCQRVEVGLGRGPATLFGPCDAERFFYRLKTSPFQKDQDPCGEPAFSEYDIVGGFQTSEKGIDLPRYHEMIRSAVRNQMNITVLLGNKVQRIDGNYPYFEVHCDASQQPIACAHVVQAAWQNGPALTPLHRPVTVYRRAIVRVELPNGPLPPVFVLSGKYGGMFAPESDKTALLYLPIQGCGHIKEHRLTAAANTLPDDWLSYPQNVTETEYRENYLARLKERFPRVLKRVTNPVLIVRETLNFDKGVELRRSEAVVEVERGRYALYAMKATYAVQVALQAAYLVEKRSAEPSSLPNKPPEDSVKLVLSPAGREHYSLAQVLDRERHTFRTALKVLDRHGVRDIGEEALRNPFKSMDVLNAVNVPINVVTDDWRFGFVNSAYAAWYRLPAQELIGTPVVDLIGEEAWSSIRPYFERALDGENIYYRTHLNLPMGGREIECSYTPVRDADGNVVGWCGVMYDMADRSE